MLVAAHQPLFIPWLGYFDKISQVDLFVIVDNVQFTSSGWIRRNTIKSPSGFQTNTVPVLQIKNSSQQIKDLLIDLKDFRWRKNHLKSYDLYYSKAKFFNDIFPSLNEIYNKDWINLSDFNIELIKYILNYLGIATKILISSDLGISGSKTDLIIDICKKTEADSFMLGMGGSLIYADRDRIEAEKIRIVSQNFIHPTYTQLWGPFVSHLSILDFMFNMGKESNHLFIKRL